VNFTLGYQPPVLKTTITTLADATKFIKVNAAGKNDLGVYAAGQFYNSLAVNQQMATRFQDGITTPLSRNTLKQVAFPGYDPNNLPDMYGLMSDTSCDNDATFNPDMTCSNATQLLLRGGAYADPPTSSDDNTAVAASVGVLVPLFVIGVAVVAFVIYRRRKAEAPGFKRQGTGDVIMAPMHTSTPQA